MARVYANLCEKGVRNFFTVPSNLRDQVEEIIISDGYMINEDGTVVKKPTNEEEVTNE